MIDVGKLKLNEFIKIGEMKANNYRNYRQVAQSMS